MRLQEKNKVRLNDEKNTPFVHCLHFILMMSDRQQTKGLKMLQMRFFCSVPICELFCEFIHSYSRIALKVSNYCRR